MTQSVSNPQTFGKEIKIIRQRFFIDYTSTSAKNYSEEYTLMCQTVNKNGIDNIFIKSPKLLPNLKIYDSDGTELALVTTRLTRALITNLLSHSDKQSVQNELQKLLDDMDHQIIFLLWIKLPSTKKFFPHETRVITLEYDTSKEDISSKNYVLEFHSAPHEVFYVIHPPKDYEFDRRDMEIYESDGTKLVDQRKGWDMVPQKGDKFYYNEFQESVSIRISPSMKDQLKFIYSFKPSEKITYFPVFTLLLLSATSFLLLFATQNYFNICNSVDACSKTVTVVKNAHIEIAIGIILGALALPNLIQNENIRHSLTKYFIVPIVIAITTMFI